MQKKKSTKNRDFVAALLDRKGASVRADIESLPCEIFEMPDGEFGFRFAFGGKGTPGIVALEFYALGLGEWSVRTAKTVMRQTVVAKIGGQPGADKALEKYPEDDSEDLTQIAQVVATVFIKGLSGKLGSLLGELELETETYVRGITFKAVNTKEDNGVKRLAKEMAAEREQHLKNSIARFGAPKWENGKAYYEELFPLARKAKRVYEQNKSENWEGMVKAAFPQFDEDLVILLSDDPEDLERLPEYAKKATENSEDYSLPANIALIQSARRCGMKPGFAIGPRRIRELMDESERVKSSDKQSSLGKPKTLKRTRRKSSTPKLVSEKTH